MATSVALIGYTPNGHRIGQGKPKPAQRRRAAAARSGSRAEIILPADGANRCDVRDGGGERRGGGQGFVAAEVFGQDQAGIHACVQRTGISGRHRQSTVIPFPAE